jgi:predicted nucleotidyltransferase
VAETAVVAAVKLALARALRDAPIRDAVLIGSSVYAPDLARDIDVVVTAEQPKQVQDALRSLLEDAAGRSVDLIVRTSGEDVGNLALAIRAGEILAGEGETIREANMSFEHSGGAENSFKQAKVCLELADELFQAAARRTDPEEKIRRLMGAFDQLFHAARIAALCYLGRTSSGWGKVDQVLPPPFAAQFRSMAQTLHIQYGYEGRVTEARAAAEFETWKERVQVFVDALRERVMEHERHDREIDR